MLAVDAFLSLSSSTGTLSRRLAFFVPESVHVTCPDACWRGRHAHSASASERRNGENMNPQNRAESASIRHEIDHLRHKTVAELKVRYLEVFGEASRSNHKQFLVRRIAWRLQALAEGDLSERARERALSLARDADFRLRAPQGLPGMATTAGRHRDARLPAPGTILRRAFRDQNITVQDLERGLQYEGAVYPSLSAVARHVSGTQWNGFSFFRLPRAAVRK